MPLYYPEGESSTVELKETVPQNDQILKTIIGFCNMHGGALVLGVDNRRVIKGVPENRLDKILEYLHKMIYESCSPPIIPDIFTQRVGDYILLIIRVAPGGNRPFYIRSMGMDRGTYVRMGPNTLRADPETITELQRQSRGISFDCSPVYRATVTSIALSKVEVFLKSRSQESSTKPTTSILTAYHLICEEQAKQYPSVAGILLFSDQPQHWFPEAGILCSRFKGNSGREALSSRDSTGTLMEQFDTAFDFIQSSLDRSFTIKNRRRNERLEVPPIAIREVLLNAIVHRNYAISAPIKIAIFDNRIEVFSPGVFPGPININNLTSGITYIRNIAIAKVFREAGYIEKLGSGFIELFRSYDEWGLQKPEIIEGENFIKCILPREKLTLEKDSYENSVLRMFYKNQTITPGDLVSELGLSRATVGRILHRLENEGKLVRQGKGPAVCYKRM